MTQRVDTYAFGGGLDTNTAALAVAPGAIIAGMNYEPLAEGYSRVQGYERFDGRTAPSAARFWTLDFDQGGQAFEIGDVVTGLTSGATGTVILDPVDLAGSWGSGTAAGTLVMTNVTGAFQNNEVLRVSGSPCAIADGISTEDSAPDATLRTTWSRAAMAYQRSIIDKVPGEGPVRGVAVHRGVVYAWRNNVGSTRLACYRATATGWVAMPTLRRLPFTLGSTEIVVGDIVTGASAGGSARVVDVVVDTGTFGTADAAGYLVVADLSGTISNAEWLQVGGSDVARAGSISAYNIGPGGRVRWLSHNFYGASNLYRLYGATGASPAFELIPDEGVVLIETGMAVDTPERIFEISNHLGLTFPGGSVQFSAILNPRSFEVVLGAGEIGFGTDVTDVVQANETAVAIFGKEKIGVLQGSDRENFALDVLTEEAGADADSAQQMARTLYMDLRGLRSLDATQAFGNFKTGALSGRFEKYLNSKRKSGATIVGSFVVKTKSHYRAIWSDGTGFAVNMGGKNAEAIPFDLGDMRPFSFGRGELSDGEGVFVGGEDGYVYRLDSGNSFDGDQIKGFISTGFLQWGGEQEWRIHKCVCELDAPASAHLSITAQFNYADGDVPISGANSFNVTGSGGTWGAANWNEFYWSQPVEGRAESDIDGIGYNVSFIFATAADVDEDPHVLQAYKVWRSPRRQRR